jgi:hypothetical protein
MEQKRFSWTCAIKPALNAIIIVGMGMVSLDSIQAAQKKSYIKPPFTAFSSQMTDGLSGGGKYEKPVWNLHNALKLPNWLELGVEQRTRYETMDGNFRGGSKGGDQQIPLQTDIWAQAHLRDFRLGVEFLMRGPNAPNGQDIDYFYVQSMLRF